MKLQAFNAKCPLEIGDIVFIKTNETGNNTAFLIPPEFKTLPDKLRKALIGEKECVITDIAVIHYCREGIVNFQYEVDKSGRYEPLDIVIPVKR